MTNASSRLGARLSFLIMVLPACDPTSGMVAFPETCQDAKDDAVAAGDRPSDGSYTLYVDGDESLPWTAYCYEMTVAIQRNI